MDNGKAKEKLLSRLRGGERGERVKAKLYSGGVGSGRWVQAGGRCSGSSTKERRGSLRSEEKDGEDARPLDTEPSLFRGGPVRVCTVRGLSKTAVAGEGLILWLGEVHEP